MAFVAVLIGGSDYREFEVKKDAELEGQMQDAAEKFWQDHVLAGVPPELDGDDTTTDYLAKKFPVNDQEVRVATAEEQSILAGYRDLLKQLDELEGQAKLYENQIKNAIGQHKGLAAPVGRVTWSWQAGKRKTDWEKLAADLGATPDQIAKATGAGTPFRCFRKSWKE